MATITGFEKSLLVGTYNDEDHGEEIGKDNLTITDRIELGTLTGGAEYGCDKSIAIRSFTGFKDDETHTHINVTPDEALRFAEDLKALAISMGAK